MHTQQDFEYIVQNAGYINHVVKKRNNDSTIVFLCNSNVVSKRNFPFQYYNMPKAWKCATQDELRSYFDHAYDFLTFCGENYSGVNFIKNLDFDIAKYSSHQFLIMRRYRTLTALLMHDFSGDIKSDKTVIYGAGVIGKELYKRISNLTSVIYFIDRRQTESNFEGIPIVQVEDVDFRGRGG